MTYTYLYQTKKNENREGVIRAKNREAAYHALRSQGIRPYRIIGDDPFPWQPWALAGLVLVLVAALIIVLLRPLRLSDSAPRLRQQIVGDDAFIAEQVAADWSNTFATGLDRYLAAYVQPGGNAVPPYIEPEAVEALAADLNVPLDYPADERSECRQVRNMVAYLREEMRSFLTSGKTVAEYFSFLENRQREEIALWQHAEQSIRKAPASYRGQMAAGVNAQLRARGIAPVPVSIK